MPETDLIRLLDDPDEDGCTLWAGSARWPDGLRLGTYVRVPADATPVVRAERQGDSAMVEVFCYA